MAIEPTTTRAELRSRIAAQLGDRLALTATANGTNLTFMDTLHLGSQMENPRNREIVFTSGSNAGLVRRITTADLSTSVLTVNQALTAATAAGDTAEVYNYRGNGWLIDDYHTAINAAIDKAWPAFKVPVAVDVALPFDKSSPVLTVPTTITHVEAVRYLDTNGDYQTVSASLGSGLGWEINTADGTITVRGDRYLSVMDGLTVRLIGGARETPLTTDSSTTLIDAEWIVLESCAFLALMAYHRGSPEYYNTGLTFQQRADRIRPRSRGTMRAVRAL